MNKSALASITAGMLFFAHPAYAKNDLVLLSESDLSNAMLVEISGDGNRLQILQERTGGTGTNTIDVTIAGDGNGGPLGSSFTGPGWQSGLQPGNLTQIGFDNAMTISVEGSHNLFAFSQSGNDNMLTASIAGFGNQAAVVQQGMHNHAGFSQNGIGNMISITQISW